MGPVGMFRAKIYTPGGYTKEYLCGAAIADGGGREGLGLYLVFPSGESMRINKKSVIVDTDRKVVVYSPRRLGRFNEYIGESQFFTKKDKDWLRKNPHWPNLLELEENYYGSEDEGSTG